MAELARLGLYVDSSGVVRATKELQKLERKGKGAERQSDKLKRSFGGLKTAAIAVGSAIAAIGVTRLIGNVADAGIALDAMESSLRVATGSAEGAAAEFQFLREESERLGLDLRTSGDAFASLAAAARGTALEGQGARDIFVAVSEAMTALGRDSEATEGALRAIEQMISKGNVSAEELRGQLGERLPGAFQIAARAAGVTTQELDKMLRNGEVLAEDLLPLLANELSNTFSAEAERRANGLQAEINRFKTAVFELMASGNMDGLANSIRNITELVSDPGFQQSFSSFVGGVIQLAEWGSRAAAGVSDLARFMGENLAKNLYGPLLDSPEEVEKAINDVESQIEQLDSELERSRLFRVNPFKSDEELLQDYNELVNRLNQLKQIKQSLESTPTISAAPGISAPAPSGVAQGSSPTGQEDERSKAADRLAESYRNLTDDLTDQYTMLGMTERAAFIYEAQLKLSEAATDDMRQTVEELAGRLYDEQQAIEAAAEAELERNRVLEQGKALTEAMYTPMEAYLAQLERIDDLADAAAISEETAARARQKAFEDMKGVSKAVADDMTVFMEEFAKNTQNLLADNLFDFMQGEFEFTADSFKNMLDRMVAEAIAADLAGKIFGSSMGGTGDGWMGALLSSVGSFFGGARAEGGPVSSGKTYLVGERGPELFTPSGSGSIVPNNQITNNGVTVNVNVSGIQDGADLRRSAAQIAQQAGAAANRALARNG